MALRPYLLDASALLKLFLDEPGSDRVRTLFQRASWIETTWLCVAETYGRLKALWLKGQIDEGKYLSSLFVLNTYLRDEKVTLTGQMVQDLQDYLTIRDLVQKHAIDFSDALQFVAIRESMKATLVGDSRPMLVTSDGGMLEVARLYGIVTWNPEGDDPIPQPEIRPLRP